MYVDSELNQVVDIVSSSIVFAALKSDGSVVVWGKTAGDSSSVSSELSSGVVEIYSTKEALAHLRLEI